MENNNFDYDSMIQNDVHMNMFSNYFDWIKINMKDSKYYKIKVNLVDQVYFNLNLTDKILLTDHLVMLINFIHNKFNFVTKTDSDKYWTQLMQNNMLDLRALLNILLPYISDDSIDSKKYGLKSLKDLYLTKEKGRYVYTNMQYNRCIRFKLSYDDPNDTAIKYIERPFHKDYFIHHFKLLLMSIETASNKLYINWIDILPIKMDEYKTISMI